MAPNPPAAVFKLLTPSRPPLPGMGAVPAPEAHGGVTFRVWAPFAERVIVAGTFNSWLPKLNPLSPEADGMWAVHVDRARPGHRYHFVIRYAGEDRDRIHADPYVREVDPTTRLGIIHSAEADPSFS